MNIITRECFMGAEITSQPKMKILLEKNLTHFRFQLSLSSFFLIFQASSCRLPVPAELLLRHLKAPLSPRVIRPMATETPKKSGPPKIVTLNKASKLAEQWLNKMNGSGQDEVVEAEPEARPERLGLGAKVPRQSKVGLSNDPVARKLSAKLGVGKRKASRNQDSTTPSGQDMVNEDDGDEDLDSRSSAFSRKRAVPLTSQLQVMKKPK
ncbi:hypothetical protein GQ457_13G029340 [Hibiscus cannabinus]